MYFCNILPDIFPEEFYWFTFPPACMRASVPVFPQSCQQKVRSYFLIFGYLIAKQW